MERNMELSRPKQHAAKLFAKMTEESLPFYVYSDKDTLDSAIMAGVMFLAQRHHYGYEAAMAMAEYAVNN